MIGSLYLIFIAGRCVDSTTLHVHHLPDKVIHVFLVTLTARAHTIFVVWITHIQHAVAHTRSYVDLFNT